MRFDDSLSMVLRSDRSQGVGYDSRGFALPEPERLATPFELEAAFDAFRFQTNAAGTIISVEGVAGETLVGLSIAHSRVQGAAQLDGVAPGAFRRRSRFDGARLEVVGYCVVAGSWRLSAVPAFDGPTGRFTGFRGAGRRPRADECAVRPGPAFATSLAPLRRLVQELRAPPIAAPGSAGLIEGGAPALRSDPVAIRPLIERVRAELAPLAALRRVRVIVDGDENGCVRADERAAERLLTRLVATLLSAGSPGETLRASSHVEPATVDILLDRPRSLGGLRAEALLALHAEEGAPLLGAGFALRVARNLATELGGELDLGPARLRLRLPAALGRPAEHATTV